MNKQKVVKTKNAQEKIAESVSAQDLKIEVPTEKKSAGNNIAIYVRSLLQNWRQGTVACKGRSDVAYSNKKPWKQKGTGRARAGSARSPLWRGGGVTFGPQARTRVLKATQKVKKNAMKDIFFNFLNDGKVISLDWNLAGDKPKTVLAYNALINAGLDKRKITLFLAPNDILSHASFANIPNVRVLYFDQPNAYDLVNCSHWVFLKNDADNFKKMVSQWI
jgi:large subunit ribosomal protein L4